MPALAARFPAAAQPAPDPAAEGIDHDLARRCSECGATDPERCQGCGALACLDCLELRSGELLCFECRRPPLCREPGCTVRMARPDTGLCRTHHAADLDRWIASIRLEVRP